MSKTVRNHYFESLILALGLIIAAAIGTQALISFKAADRFVSVKGLAEQEVPADTVIWTITFNEASDDLKKLHQQLAGQGGKIAEFLKQRGLNDSDINIAPPEIFDVLAQRYGNQNQPGLRYRATQNVVVGSQQVELVRELMQQTTSLVEAGVVFTGYAQYLFTGLNAIKPGMIEEATRNAKDAARKFAQDSDSQVGKIRSARQGFFSIEDRDTNTPHIKRVRVVTNVEYYLVDD